MNAKRKSKSPYQKYGKTPFRYSELIGVAHQRMLVQRFGAGYWIKLQNDGKPAYDDRGHTIPMFGHEAYRVARAEGRAS